MSISPGSLTPLQVRVLEALRDVEPPWTLTGGAALGLRFGHRTTRDLDLFWHGRETLDEVVASVELALQRAGLAAARVQTSPGFVRLQVDDGDAHVVVDLVASPLPVAAPPQQLELAGGPIQVDALHELLVAKLCALLGRSEPRDLWDVETLLGHDLGLERAVNDARDKDAGFSALTLAWVLRGLDIEALAPLAGIPTDVAARLSTFRDELIAVLTSLEPTDAA